jgi:hypothetical protein
MSSVFAYRLVYSRLEVEVYRSRLAELSDDLWELRDQYNQVVMRTAVTELLVEDGTLSVHIRSARGLERSIPTPFDPSAEIYVDYVVIDGRLWIRRVFDNATPPLDGLIIDPELVAIDWDAEGAVAGKAIYRALGDGRWVVTVTGDGSLGIAPLAGGEVANLAPPPPVREYRELEGEIEDALREAAMAELFDELLDEVGAALGFRAG